MNRFLHLQDKKLSIKLGRYHSVEIKDNQMVYIDNFPDNINKFYIDTYSIIEEGGYVFYEGDFPIFMKENQSYLIKELVKYNIVKEVQ